jgi:hypothetical protein
VEEFTNKNNYLGSVSTPVNKLLIKQIICQQNFWQLPLRDWQMQSLGAVKSCLAPNLHNGESEQDFATSLVKQLARSSLKQFW